MNLLKRYIFWTYQRGSFHYDVMVTLILLFIFVSPRFINFADKPVPEPQVHGHEVLVQASEGGALVYQVSAKEVQGKDEAALDPQFAASIAPIAGAVAVDRYEEVRDPNGKLSGYKVFAHRLASSGVQ